MKPRPPRRTLHRQRRVLPAHLEHRALADELLRQRLPAGVARLERLFGTVWHRGRESVWTCAELCEHGVLQPAATRSTGQALAALHAAGGRLGPWQLVRHHTDRTGRLWQLRRMW